MQKMLRCLLLALSVSLPSGCGYQFQGSGSVLPPDVKVVAIPLVENSTTTPGIDVEFTEALRSRFDRYGAVKVVEDRSDGDAVLKARIVRLQNRVRNVTSSTDIELELELVMTVSAELTRRNGQVLWKNPSFQTTESFASVEDVVVTSSSEFAQSGIGGDSLSSLGSREVSRGQQEQAITKLVNEAARKIYLSAVAPDF